MVNTTSNNANNSILKVQGVSKFYNEVIPALDTVSFSMKRGEIVCLVGPSGSGKTTLLRTLSDLEKPDSGSIEYQTQKNKRNSSFVAQDFNLWPHKTVLENIMFAPVHVCNIPENIAHQEALALLEKCELLDKKDTYPDFLSGGQKQRAAIMRALAIKPQVLLLDEITSALDPELVHGVLNLIKVLARDGQSMILATHHLKFALEVADRIIFMENGKIVQDSQSNDFVYAQKNTRIKEFLKTLSLSKQEINVYEGFNEFQAYQLGTLKRFKPGSSKNVVGSSGDRWFKAMGPYYQQYEKLRIEKKISWKMIMYDESPRDRDIRLRHPTLNTYRILPKHLENPANYYVIDDVVVIQIFGLPGDEPAIIEIKNAHIAKSYQNYFNLLWEQSIPIY